MDFTVRKMELSDEEIIKYLQEGRNFHIKEIGKYTYVITRKGQKTWSHGSYNDKYWNRIMRLKKDFLEGLIHNAEINNKGEPQPDTTELLKKQIKKHQKLLKTLQDEMKLFRALNMFPDCTHNEEGYCSYWKIPDGIPLLKNIDDYYEFFGETREQNVKRFVDKNGAVLWKTRANALFCQNCSAFFARACIGG